MKNNYLNLNFLILLLGLTFFSLHSNAQEYYTLTNDDVVVSNGVITSCSYDFVNTNILIPEQLDEQTITEIGDNVFKEKGLTGVQLPASLTTIGKYAFNMNQLVNIVIPDAVTDIGEDAFSQNRLTTVVIPNGISVISTDVFAENNLSTVNIPEGVTEIGNRAFTRNQLSNISLPKSLKSIGYMAFAYNSLGNIVIPDGVTFISVGAFSGTLGHVTLGAPVKEGHKLKHWKSNNDRTYAPGAGITNFDLSYEAVFEILTYYNISGTVTGADAIKVTMTGDAEDEKTVNDGETYTFTVEHGQSVVITPSKEGYTFMPASHIFNIIEAAHENKDFQATDYYTLSDDDVVVTNGVLTSCSYDFDIKKIIIPEQLDGQTVISIGSAFKEKGLKAVKLPSTLVTIEGHAFYKNQLSRVTFPSGLKTIGKSAFSENQLGSVIIPEGVTSIEDYTFYKNQLSSVTIPETATTIGKGAFRKNQLSSVTIPETVTSIDIYAFASNQLSSVTIPEGVTTIGGSAFYENQLTSVTIPETVSTIESYVFGKNLLSSVTIPEGVTTIGGSAFYQNQLTSIVISEGVTSIGNSAFNQNRLSSISLPNSITLLEKRAFANNSNLNSITLPSPVKEGHTLAWTDNNGATYGGGESVTNFELKYEAKFEINTYTISGTVTGADAVTITMTGNAEGEQTVNAGETYTFTVEHGQSVVITPSKEGYTFVNDKYELNTVTENKVDIDFAATAIPIKKYKVTLANNNANGNYCYMIDKDGNIIPEGEVEEGTEITVIKRYIGKQGTKIDLRIGKTNGSLPSNNKFIVTDKCFLWVNSRSNDKVTANYQFNENADDETNNNWHGTLQGTNYSFVQDRHGNNKSALNLSQDGDCLELNPLLKQNRSSFSASFWVNPSQSVANCGIFGCSNAETNKTGIALSKINNKLVFKVANKNGGFKVESYADLTINKWTHIVMTFAQRNISLYVDGKLAASKAIYWDGYYSPILWGANSKFYFGRNYLSESGGSQFIGAIDDLQLYYHAISAADVSNLYDAVPTAIEDIKTTKLTLFPNPATNQVNIVANSAGTIEIISITGVNIYSETVNTSKTIRINTSGYAKGIYLLRFKDNNGNVQVSKLKIR